MDCLETKMRTRCPGALYWLEEMEQTGFEIESQSICQRTCPATQRIVAGSGSISSITLGSASCDPLSFADTGSQALNSQYKFPCVQRQH
jgi:hypothetical protein